MAESNVKDSNGNTLNDGDSVTLIKSLKVKGGGVTLKQGTLVKKIRLTDDDGAVDCKIDGMSIVLKTEFLKKR
ncbi:protein PhnA [Mucilaginibacter sp. UYP25]|uniref:zinc ribbon domain-containing protein YjdM n=1 Tax=unclassified Mucilaginibacter TaxID=2617802 RepID=UPI003392288A